MPPLNYSPSKPFYMYQTSNQVSMLGILSQYFLVILVLSYSIFLKNINAGFYCLFAWIAYQFRNIVIKDNGGKIGPNESGDINVRYSNYGSSTFSIFLFAFTIVYLLAPMFQTGAINWIFVVVLFTYFCLDIFVKISYKWIRIPNDINSILGNIVSGAFAGGVALAIMVVLHLEKYLFFIDSVQNGTVCSRPKQQTFKCLVYKNGQLVNS